MEQATQRFPGLRPLLAVATLVATICAPSTASATAVATDPTAPGTDDRVAAQVAPLGARDAELYRRIFALQAAGDLAAAEPLIAQLEDHLLLGHVQLQRFLRPTAAASYTDLAAWLERHADHPDADQVHRLAEQRQPAGAASLARPVRGYLAGNGQELQERGRPRPQAAVERSPADAALVRAWVEEIEALVRADRLDDAVAVLHRPDMDRLVEPVDVDLARWTIAQMFFADGQDQAAHALAKVAAAGSATAFPEIHWTAGISAWRLGRIEAAAAHFMALADTTDALPAERARAAFWAARAHMVTAQPALAQRYLALAADHPDSFYGLLAGQALGRRIGDDLAQAPLGGDAALALLRHEGARRALALAQVGQVARAEAEIRKLAARAEPEVVVGLIGLAERLDLPAVQMRLAQRLGQSDARPGDLYPLPRWRPAHGFTVDRALVYAIARAESAFDPTARSHAGAQGLMQIMPTTARYIAARSQLVLAGHDDLLRPETSLSFGQWYLGHLLESHAVEADLIHLALAYNAGPGRLAKWRAELDYGHDPLLFLESVPHREPRVYVKKVLTNLWRYRARLGQSQPSLAALAHNRWPTYGALDDQAKVSAAR